MRCSRGGDTLKALTILIQTIAMIVPTQFVAGSRTKSLGQLATVSRVDIQRYLGAWYEIARYPNRFEQNCVGVTATYSLRKDGMINVYNHAYLHTLAGKEFSITGKAKISDATNNAKLRVSFFGPFYADYWIISLGEEYDYAVVSEPSRQYLWILSRTPQMEEERYQQILHFLAGAGFDICKLSLTLQSKQ
jgi:apolipoprotein D and lipocalin family protein